MLSEDQVVCAVTDWLRSQGYELDQELTTLDKGDDIIATTPQKQYRLFIEAKGESSSKEGTPRFGKPFTRSQVKTHVGVAFYRAAQMLENDSGIPVRVALAFPDNKDHRDVVARIKKALTILKVTVFWVAPDGTVSVEGLI